MIQLNYRDARPIYEQVKDGLRHLVVTGALQAGDKLPSVRALACLPGHQPPTPSSGPTSPWSGRAICTRWRARAPSPPPRPT